MKMNNKKGFTLVELMVTVSILGILGAIAYPAYQEHTGKAKCSDGTGPLLILAGRMEEVFLNTDSYTSANVTTLMASDQTPNSLYTLAISSATNFAYTLTATPADTNQNILTLDSLGNKTEAGGGATNPATVCWNI